jgi:hypothetical protein
MALGIRRKPQSTKTWPVARSLDDLQHKGSNFELD